LEQVEHVPKTEPQSQSVVGSGVPSSAGQKRKADYMESSVTDASAEGSDGGVSDDYGWDDETEMPVEGLEASDELL
jgi:hypothetical protein